MHVVQDVINKHEEGGFTMYKLISNFESVEGTKISFVAGKTICAPKRFMTIP